MIPLIKAISLSSDQRRSSTIHSHLRQTIPDLRRAGPNAKLWVDGMRLMPKALRVGVIVWPIALPRGSVEWRWLMLDGDRRESGIAIVWS
jgi:hypothetical protein